MNRLFLACLVLGALGCQNEYECVEAPVRLEPAPHPIGDTTAYRLMYLGENGLTVTMNPNVIPWYVEHAVWVDLGDERPSGLATVVDIRSPDSPIKLMTREDAIILAHAGAIGFWAGNLAIERSQLLAELSPRSDAYKKALEDTDETQEVLGDDGLSLFTMDRRRRLRTAIWAQPQLTDFIKSRPKQRWFATPECPSSGDMPSGYLMTNIDQAANKRLWSYLFKWTGQKPSIPAIY